MPSKTCPQCGTEYELDKVFCALDGATLVAPATGDDLVGRVFSGKYRIIKKLGGGGMGNVYLAEHVRLKKPTAVKVIRPALGEDANALARFNREAQNASMINHPNVASVYDFGETDNGLIFLAMEFIEGQPLGDIITAGPIAPLRAANIVRQVSDALMAAHRMGIVHRDLKPDNIMVARHHDGGDFVKLVDFGISKVPTGDDQKITVTGSVVGTPAYMSPEQVKAGNFDGRSDIYSLGIVVFQMLTGELPFEGTTPQEQIISRLMVPPHSLQKVRPDVQWSGVIEGVIAKALAPEPGDRYQTAQDFSAAFSQAARVSGALAPTLQLPPDEVKKLQTTPDSRGASIAATVEEKPAPPRSRLPLFGGLAAIVLIGAVGGLIYMKSSKEPDGTAITPSPLPNQPVATQPAESIVAPTPSGRQTTSPPAPEVGSSRVLTKGSTQTSSPAGAGTARGVTSPPKIETQRTVSERPPVAVDTAKPATGSAPPKPEPAAPAQPDMDEAIRVLSSRVAQEGASDSELQAAVADANALLKRARSSSDTIRILYPQSRAYYALGDRDASCRVLTRIKPMATGTRLEGVVSGAHERLCQ